MSENATTQDILNLGRRELEQLAGHQFDLVTIGKPDSLALALDLMKIVSKLSPLVGNLIEHKVCSYLNGRPGFPCDGKWIRQDPDFPDAIFKGSVDPIPGFEIKAWFPLATEITARFKESQKYFLEENTDLLLLAWLPEHVFYGAPKIIDAISIPASKIAKDRDDHYFNPPDYLVLEPENTDQRRRNLQQSCVNGHRFQGSDDDLKRAKKDIAALGSKMSYYSLEVDFQEELQRLVGKYRYRLDTNFAKIDRIDNEEIESFKEKVLSTDIHGRRISEWARLIARASDEELIAILHEEFGIG